MADETINPKSCGLLSGITVAALSISALSLWACLAWIELYVDVYKRQAVSS